MSAEKKLTAPPKDLKEAIDWVLRVSGGDHNGGAGTDRLATALTASIYKTSDKQSNDVDKILTEMKKDEQKIKPNGPIKQLGDGLTKFIGYQSSGSRNTSNYKITISGTGIMTKGDIHPNKSPVYTSAYTGSWYTHVSVGSPQNPTYKEITCARIFFTAIEKIFEGLTELYYNCKKGWSTQSLNGSTDALNQFMQNHGFMKPNLNTNKDGNGIAKLLDSGLSEFTTAYSAAGHNPSLDAFRYQLEQNASTSPSKSPLSALYILATYVYVQSSNPATPSFLGYSGLAVLAGGAYGFNLGGLGTFMSALLA
ncbi:uncharacterized protein BcabD6B2_54750 [Babesia caballi]|uniref:Uncharacterized protein n=1 Tax=Babesia caballi TaxID=5871 RepID=A0AAV4M118_BABCB|nr:hypothetical protein, conserved [Babesia caballi]